METGTHTATISLTARYKTGNGFLYEFVYLSDLEPWTSQNPAVRDVAGKVGLINSAHVLQCPGLARVVYGKRMTARLGVVNALLYVTDT